MKKDGKYRFSLQFGVESEEQRRAGELLEKLGNRKSTVIVAALNEYLISHPDLQSDCCKIEIKLTSGENRDEIEEMIRAIVEERLAVIQTAETQTVLSGAERRETLESDVAQMLDNLDMFI